MKTTIRYVILTAARDRLFAGLLTLLVVVYAVSFLYGGTSVVEEKEAALAFAAGSARLLLTLGLIVFTCFHIRRGFDSKEIELLLSKPVGRFSFIISYWAGLAIVAAMLSLACFSLLFLVSLDVTGGMTLWIISLAFELIIVLSASLAISLMLSSAVTAALGSVCFYVMARMSGFFIATVDFGKGGLDNIFAKVGAIFVKLITIFIPRLDQFTQSSWLVYGGNIASQGWFVLAQSVIYVPLLLGLAYFDFRRREF